jgi:hypothetical protein
MDARGFDALSRLLAKSGSRRGALKAALVAAFGGAALAVDEGAARPALCRPAGRYCTHNKQCCNKRCRIGKRVPMASRNICDCDAPYGMCGKMCRDFSSDPNNCGGCGIQIDAETELCCDGSPTPIDEDNCHACGEVCGPDDVCCGPEIGCAASCEPADTCVGGVGLGGACQSPVDCCSLACDGGVCVEPSMDCTTFSGAGLANSDTALCYREAGETLGALITVGQLYCPGSSPEVPSDPQNGCASSEECQAYADSDGMTGVRGICTDQAVICYGPAKCSPISALGNVCVFINTADATCP